MSTISDVAQRAGVSAMTVSRVINNSGYVSATTRQRVERAIAELGYVPNALARQLRSKRTKTLALIVSDITNPFFTTIARGVEDVAAPRGFSVMYCNTDESAAKEAQYLRVLIERQVDGVLFVPTRGTTASFRTLRAHRMPVVVLDRRVTDRRVDSVRCDSEAGAHALTRHLISLGHRRIAVLTGRRTISTSVDRVAGCRRALEETGLELDDALVRYGGYNFGLLNQADGYQMAREVLASASPPPTAIFAANNFIAFGAMFFTLVVTDSSLGFGITRLLGGLAFSTGLILVIVGGAELFTGNNLIAMAWASGEVTTGRLLRSWALVYAGNLVGSLGSAVFVWLSGTLHLADGAIAATAVSIASAKVALPFGEAFIRGILCNALVCLAV